MNRSAVHAQASVSTDMPSLLQVFFLCAAVAHGATRVPPAFPGLRSVKQLARAAGYDETDVEVITEDGYSLWMHRIGNNQGPPVLIQHGILVASESWIIRGPRKDLAFLLVKEGYDVWLGNQRGTVYNEYSLTHNRSDPQFWNFSFHESAYYDMPAFIDKILQIRGVDQLFYIGHSLGSTVFLAMASTRPEYNHKIRAAALLSPVAFAPSFDEMSPLFRMLLKNAQIIFGGLNLTRQYELAFRSTASIKSLEGICGPKSTIQVLCLDLYGLLAGEHRVNIDKKDYGVYMTYFGAGTSTKTLYHLSQLFRTGEFKQFDFENKQQNLLAYNSSVPPTYDLGQVTAPVALYWGYNDPFLSEESVSRLEAALPNLVYSKAVPDPLFTHLDMFLGENADRVLFPDIIDLFASFSYLL